MTSIKSTSVSDSNANIVSISKGSSVSFLKGFSWTITRLFLETFLASKSRLTAKERKTIQDGLSVLENHLGV